MTRLKKKKELFQHFCVTLESCPKFIICIVTYDHFNELGRVFASDGQLNAPNVRLYY